MRQLSAIFLPVLYRGGQFNPEYSWVASDPADIQ